MPWIIPEDGFLPPYVDVVLIVCTNSCFHSPPFVRQFLTADQNVVHFIPVVAIGNCRSPVCGQINEEMRKVAVGQKTLGEFVRVIDTIFKETAIDFILQASEDVLALFAGSSM